LSHPVDVIKFIVVIKRNQQTLRSYFVQKKQLVPNNMRSTTFNQALCWCRKQLSPYVTHGWER